ncbi:hypothetical protein DAEQUDRAFT_659485 [Daedalea quercina L-15889]|uniref:YDG domain-containing protein n=1 Tax=Daedalea quercina L-15889 TaxID=1314783 RepID=A0A165UB37_9APHY|nr:hypothetical protein DAEQUDRAFT_659485 [Daedalea quercina L-15889]
MSPTPIQPGFVHLILQYIAPPSQLTQPIPPHLLSKSLLQRHHFLQITPDNPHEYLCWPTSGGRAIELLEDLPQPLDDEPVPYPVQYTSDAEQAYAHVGLPIVDTDGARMVFEWDEADGWKYHDLAMMPFPPGSRATLQELTTKETGHVQRAVSQVSETSYVVEPYANGSDDDDYWNAYGSQDDAAAYNNDPLMSNKDAEAGTEDAYWARYSSVHGTADSARPSPPPHPKRKLYAMEPNIASGTASPNPLPVPARSDLYYSHGDTLPMLGSFPPKGNSRWDPASPRALAQLLAEVPPRASPSPSPLSVPEEADADSEVSSPTVGGSSGSDEGSLTSVSIPGDVSSGATRLGATADDAAEEMRALRDGIRGLWKLWEMGRRKRSEALGSDDDKKLFLEVVRDTAARNAELDARVEELERELSVWKAALKTAEEEKRTLSKTVTKLERNIGSLKEDNPLILCLIDGDGNIFSQDLLRLGLAGGRQAAALLTKGLNDHLASFDSPDIGRGQLWLTIYFNKTGLLETLTQNNVCDAEQFEAFLMGFNQASPLFSMVDVGSGKEAADSKIKECLRVFTRFPQTSKVLFGGAHDNGYTSTLNYLQNEGLVEKIILLRGYKELAYEIKGLQLPHIEIEGLFMKKKLYTHSSKKANNAQSAPGTPPQITHDVDKLRSKAATPTKHNIQSTPSKKIRLVSVDQVCSNRVSHATLSNAFFSHCISFLTSSILVFTTCPYYAMTFDYDELCAQNKAHNVELLKSLVVNLDIPAVPTAPKKQSAPRKRKVAPRESDEESETSKPAKTRRVSETTKKADGKGTTPETTGLRRSGRNRDKKVDYSADHFEIYKPGFASVEAGLREMKTEPRSVNKRIHDPKVFGAIPGIPVGTWWMTREECSTDAIHAPWVAGIAGGPDGAYSVALSGGYEDDVDLGEAFTYTGAGGRDLKGTKQNPKNVGSPSHSA